MKESHLLGTDYTSPSEVARLTRRRRWVVLCLVCWTAFVGVSVWWLMGRNAGPSVWIVDESDTRLPVAAEKFRAFFKADIGLQRVYPWVLLGPYVALLAFWFPLEQGRLRLSLPLNLAACAAFIVASHGLNARIGISGKNVVIIRSRHSNEAATGGRETNTAQIEVIKTGPGNVHEDFRGIRVVETSESTTNERTIWPGREETFNGALTNMLAHLPQGLKPPIPPAGSPQSSPISMLMDLLAYGAIFGMAHSVHYYRRFREREHRALFLESTLTNARLNALRAQLQPHFLFNSLNAIAALLRRDPKLAEATLLSLSDLLRLALSQSEKQVVSLREELEFVQRYLEIQQTRFGEKLRVEQDIEPTALDCLVPTLLLQPLVENAIRHGIEPAENAGLVRMTARRQGSSLVLTVEDDGVGMNSSDNGIREPKSINTGASTPSVGGGTGSSPAANVVKNGTGIGLKNLQTRLETLYGARQKLELMPGQEGGVTVRIEIPFQPTLLPAGAGACQ